MPSEETSTRKDSDSNETAVAASVAAGGSRAAVAKAISPDVPVPPFPDAVKTIEKSDAAASVAGTVHSTGADEAERPEATVHEPDEAPESAAESVAEPEDGTTRTENVAPWGETETSEAKTSGAEPAGRA